MPIFICYNAYRQNDIRSPNGQRQNTSELQLTGIFIPFLQGGLNPRLIAD